MLFRGPEQLPNNSMQLTALRAAADAERGAKTVGRNPDRCVDWGGNSVDATDMSALSDQELRLTAALYVRLGAAKHVRENGRLPEMIGGTWNVIPMRLVLEERGTDIQLTPDEQLVYEAILREGRLPGGAIRLSPNADQPG